MHNNISFHFFFQKGNISYDDVIGKAIDNVRKNIEGVEDVYALSLVAYALHLAKHQSRTEVLEQLLEKLRLNGMLPYLVLRTQLGDVCRLLKSADFDDCLPLLPHY